MFKKHFRKAFFACFPFILVGIIALIYVDIIQLEIPLLTGKIINMFKLGSNLDKDYTLSLILEIIKYSSLVFGFRILWRIFILASSKDIGHRIKLDLFSHVLKLDQFYYKQNKTGKVMSYFTEDINSILMLYGFGIMQFFDGTFLLIFTLRKMFLIDFKLTLISFIPLFIIVISISSIRKEITKKYGLTQKSLEKMSDFVQESFSGFQVIRAYVREIFESKRFEKRRTDYFNKAYDLAKSQTKFGPIIFLMISASFTAIAAFGTYLISYGNLNAGDLTAFFMFFGTLMWPMSAISGFLQALSKASESAKRINQFLETKPILKDNKTLNNFNLEGEIEFNHLSFKYPDSDKYVLEDITFKIEKGETVGIIGKTGSGKSTIVELLLRLYNVNDGELLFDNIPVNKIKNSNIRKYIGYVPQDNFLFSDTIENNINFSKTNTKSEIEKATKNASVYDNINNFPEGFNTKIGERGVMLSGGQKQRISIARAIIKDPKILILDDSVSAVDLETEKEILRNIKNINQKTTTIFIAHRISTVKNCDKIIFLVKGKIIGIGNHNTLIKTCKEYENLASLQDIQNEIGTLR